MSLYLIDTNIFSLYLRKDPVVTSRLNTIRLDEIAVSIITVEEVLTGWFTRIHRAKSREDIAYCYQQASIAVAALSRIRVISYTETAIVRYEMLKAMKLNVSGNDLRIAAIALEFGGIVVTQNVRDFERIPELIIEDWTVPIITGG